MIIRAPLALAATLFVVLSSSSPASAQSGWRTVAYKTVGAGTDRDTIRVRGDARYRQVRLCSINRPIVMQDFSVRFANGRTQDIRVRNRIAAGSCTRAAELNGGRRNIEEIRLVYGRLERGVRTPLIRVQVR
jgi:hypothetical protein